MKALSRLLPWDFFSSLRMQIPVIHIVMGGATPFFLLLALSHALTATLVYLFPEYEIRFFIVLE